MHVLFLDDFPRTDSKVQVTGSKDMTLVRLWLFHPLVYFFPEKVQQLHSQQPVQGCLSQGILTNTVHYLIEKFLSVRCKKCYLILFSISL